MGQDICKKVCVLNAFVYTVVLNPNFTRFNLDFSERILGMSISYLAFGWLLSVVFSVAINSTSRSMDAHLLAGSSDTKKAFRSPPPKANGEQQRAPWDPWD